MDYNNERGCCRHREKIDVVSPCEVGIGANNILSEVNDSVNHPSHYTTGSIECIDAIEASMEDVSFIGYCKGNAMKYLWRLGLKGDMLEDAKKAQWYINRIVKTLSA